jgi:hypothetical protein
MKTLLYQQTNVAIWWDDDGWLYTDWIGVQSSNNLVASCEQLLRLLQSRHASNLLIDHSRIEGVASEAAEWIGREWFPRMRHAGLQRTAWVRSPAGHGQLAAEAAFRVAPAGSAHLFWTIGEAEAWLRWEASLALKRKSGRISLLL